MSLLQSKEDKYGTEIKPGDICFYKSELCIYQKPSWGGEGSKGTYGRFAFPDGTRRSIRFTSVIFGFDPLGVRRNRSEEVKRLTKLYYEGE